MPPGGADHEIERISNGQNDPKIEIDAMPLAFRARDALHQIRNIRLSPLIKLHVGMDREGIAARQADPFTFAVGLHGPPVDAELIRFADGAPDGAQARFDLFHGYGRHGCSNDPV